MPATRAPAASFTARASDAARSPTAYADPGLASTSTAPAASASTAVSVPAAVSELRTITGIGRDQASRIWFRALDVYMTSGTTYAQACTATLNAAADLYGATSTQRAAVAAAWSAVNVG